jgi:hypothetical protein
MPLDFAEAEHPHGVWILELLDNVGPQPGLARFVPIESRPLVTHEVDLTVDPSAELDLGDPVQWARDAVVRLRYTATEEQARRIDHGQIRQALLDAGARQVYAIQPTIVRADRTRADDVDETLEPMAALDAWIRVNDLDDDKALPLRDYTADLLEAAR